MKKLIRSSGIYWLWLTFVLLILDFGIKQFVINTMNLYENYPIMPSLNWIYIRNFGAAFSFLADEEGWQCWFFSGVSIVISIFLIIIMCRQSVEKWLTNIAYALIISGALGNLTDRLMYGFVIDYIDFYIGNWHYPTFNLEDISICIGVFLIILEGFLLDNGK
ncbi:Lipoprotein signal peptidase [Candidatus Hartigia pinicola]|nr:Lipoprotein signal peptidase [Candidatus Hartigia pinicola]